LRKKPNFVLGKYKLKPKLNYNFKLEYYEWKSPCLCDICEFI